MNYWIYLLAMSAVTYLIRAVPLILVRKKTENRFIRSFLYYIPNAILAAMTIPAIFYATESTVSAACGFAAALLLAYRRKSLLTVAAAACLTVFAVEMLLRFI